MRSADDLRHILDGNPFPGVQPTFLHLLFLSATPDPTADPPFISTHSFVIHSLHTARYFLICTFSRRGEKEFFMKSFSATTIIAARPEKIWRILTDAENFPSWEPNVTRVEGKIALGEKITVHTKISPDRAFPVTVSVFEPNKKMVWSSGMPLGLFRGARTFTLTPKGKGQVEVVTREEFSGPLLFLIGRTIPDLSESFQTFADALKKQAETMQAAAKQTAAKQTVAK